MKGCSAPPRHQRCTDPTACQPTACWDTGGEPVSRRPGQTRRGHVFPEDGGTHDELDYELQQLLKPRQHLLLVAAEDGVQDVRHFGQDVHVVLVLEAEDGIHSFIHSGQTHHIFRGRATHTSSCSVSSTCSS